LGDLPGYRPRVGGCDDGEGRGTKAYWVVGTTDSPGYVSTLMPVAVEVSGAEEGVFEVMSEGGGEGLRRWPGRWSGRG
jgi:hypothetical protein